ncbi:hypothetical protein J28TS4_18550 [Paenibacillus lautus]|nr:hypothetical protein J28TS4_18550 [Paenibacillus lautus]
MINKNNCLFPLDFANIFHIACAMPEPRTNKTASEIATPPLKILVYTLLCL